jgi:hypothetical protein
MMRRMFRARLKIGDGVLEPLKVGGEPFKKASTEGAGALLDASVAFKLVPMLEPLPGNKGEGVCNRAAVLSLRKPVPVPPVINAGRDCGIAVKGALFCLLETRGESEFTLLFNRRMGERTCWLFAEH